MAQTPLHLACVLVAVLGLSPSCTPGAEDCAQADPDSAPPVTAVPITVDCSFYFDGTYTNISYEVGGAEISRSVGGGMSALGILSDPQYDGRSFVITIVKPDVDVLYKTLYQLDRTYLPHNQFSGEFTGLVYVTNSSQYPSLQYVCSARDPSDPPQLWGD